MLLIKKSSAAMYPLRPVTLGGELPRLRERQQNFELVRGSKYAAAAKTAKRSGSDAAARVPPPAVPVPSPSSSS